MEQFKTLGLMIDLSRNAVMSIEGWRRFVPLVADMGYNAILLYMEDVYEMEGEPYFGYMRGRYSREELKEIDAIGLRHGVEMIPCIQTLGHLSRISKWGAYKMDTGDILLVGDERTYELIDKMFKTMTECFTTKRFHIGMDEAISLGKGKYKEINGEESQSSIMRKHLARVVEIGKKYGLDMMMWSDMLFRGWNKGEYYAKKTDIPEEYCKALPESIAPIYWDYYMKTEARYDDMLSNHKQLSDKTVFAGGIWTWLGITPANQHSIDTSAPAIRMCKKHGVKDVFFTLWGDNGAECSRFSVIPALFYIAELSRGNENEADIKAKFEEKFGMPYDLFMAIDLPNEIGRRDNPYAINPSKYMLFSDVLLGYLDHTVAEGGREHYKETTRKLRLAYRKADEYKYLFEVAYRLSDILYHKYDLGVRTRRAYRAGDKEELSRIVNEDYSAIVRKLPTLIKAFRAQWDSENKHGGFEVQCMRFGGLLERMKDAKERLTLYLEGKIEKIEELEGEILQYQGRDQGKSIYLTNVTKAYTANDPG